jgi:ABC-type lipoprotein release transport system permease subunit
MSDTWKVPVSVALALAAVTLLASWIPAYRAARTDPAITLRG